MLGVDMLKKYTCSQLSPNVTVVFSSQFDSAPSKDDGDDFYIDANGNIVDKVKVKKKKKKKGKGGDEEVRNGRQVKDAPPRAPFFLIS